MEPFTFSLTSKLIHAERKRQQEKWGEQNHTPDMWLTILTEEIGEIAKAILEETFNSSPEHSHDHIAVELIQSAAVIFAFLDCMHRHELIRLDHLDLNA